jgi:hypothetical protein
MRTTNEKNHKALTEFFDQFSVTEIKEHLQETFYGWLESPKPEMVDGEHRSNVAYMNGRLIDLLNKLNDK